MYILNSGATTGAKTKRSINDVLRKERKSNHIKWSIHFNQKWTDPSGRK